MYDLSNDVISNDLEVKVQFKGKYHKKMHFRDKVTIVRE